MGLLDTLSTLTKVPMLLKVKRELAMRPMETLDSPGARVEDLAQRFPDHDAIRFEGNTVTWQQLNAQANRYAHALAAKGIEHGDTVSVLMENRIEFLVTLTALNKLGAIGALINNNLRGRPLTHCVTVANSKMCVFGGELTEALEEAKSELKLAEGSDYLFVGDEGTGATNTPNWALDLNQLSADQDDSNPASTTSNKLGDSSLYVYTSGTTGLPKAAILSNRRHLMSSSMAANAGFICDENDVIYICLPLYHGTGLLLGAGAAMLSGATMVIRRKFSASNFLSDIRSHNVTCMIYIGELCRYLMNTEAKPDDADTTLKKVMGNGLRPDIWMDFKNRFGLERVCEFYGASEGNVSFANILNKDLTVGMTSQEVALVRYDVDNDEIVRDNNGLAIRTETGEPGLLVGRITENTQFEGYTDKAATESKVLRDLLEPGDSWFNSGDLLKEVDVGYTLGYPHYQFVDRIGDTFRWRSENVSTNEVGEIINGHPDIKICNVYGVEVPGADGRAGMAAITLEQGASFNPQAFAEFVNAELPPYARPVFVRVQPDLEVTGTFKLMKTELRKTAWDITATADPIYVMKPRQNAYELLDSPFSETLKSGAAGY